MKKQLLMFAATCVAVCCFGACTPVNNNTDNDEYNVLNAMLEVSYSQLDITITDTFDENTVLKSEYSITYSDTETTVEYAVEKFNKIEFDKPATELKTTLTGVAIIVNSFVSFIGDDVGISADIAKVGLTFKKGYFENDILSDGNFSADVKNADAFLGSHVVCSNMKVTATFGDAFNDIKIIYVSEGGNEVEIKYIFNI